MFDEHCGAETTRGDDCACTRTIRRKAVNRLGWRFASPTFVGYDEAARIGKARRESLRDSLAATQERRVAVLFKRQRECSHVRQRCIHGDEVRQVGGRRSRCLDCGMLLPFLPTRCSVSGKNYHG